MSLQGSCENCTPKSGPPGWKETPGGKCSWMMKLAVRVVNALPCVLKTLAVPAFDTAAAADARRRGRPRHAEDAERVALAVCDGDGHRAVQRRGRRDGLRDDGLH